MTINPQNIGIISFGITEVSSLNWLKQVNNCNFFNRVYYFFNEGIICETSDRTIAFKPGVFYVLPSNIPLKFRYKDENVSTNHFYIDFAISEMFFKEKIFEIPLKSSLYLKKYLEFLISYLVEHNISTMTYWNKKAKERIHRLFILQCRPFCPLLLHYSAKTLLCSRTTAIP